MSTDKEYQMQAADAEKRARLAKSDLDRESWLRIAQGWMGPIRNRPQNDDEAFEAHSTAIRTQDESDTSQ